MKEKDLITIIIPVRIDSEERRTNLDAVLDYLCEYAGLKVVLLEADSKPQYNLQKEYSNIVCNFIKDDDPIFHRTRYINSMLRNIHTPIAGIWDSDVIVPVKQIIEAVKHCMKDITLCYPFDGRFYAVSANFSRLYNETGSFDILSRNESLHWLMHGRYSVGGAFVVNLEKYLSAGGENEYFYGWGPEDTERRERIANLGLKIDRVPGCLFHLHHPRGINSNFANRERESCNRREYLKICGMYRHELEEYISMWPWYNKK
ncbi:MAG: galactosyltransferase-related protein [Fermentimonas sp.]|jgi:hypothetical protein|nr:galactosyltransferase-related protein [Fermentimonas sp.]